MNDMKGNIRKLVLGVDYKKAMNYQVNQTVWDGHLISGILEDEKWFYIFIKKDGDVYPWKKFNKNMAVGVEYDLKYDGE